MATRFDTMIARLAEVRAMNMYSNEEQVAGDIMPSWVRGMMREGWVEERRTAAGDLGWYTTVEWRELYKAHLAAKNPVGRPRNAVVRVLAFGLHCPHCDSVLLNNKSCLSIPVSTLECDNCKASCAVPHRRIEELPR